MVVLILFAYKKQLQYLTERLFIVKTDKLK